MYALYVLGPIAVALVLMVCCNISAAIALSVAYLGTAAAAVIVWQVEPAAVFAMTALGVLSAVDILLIIIGAIFLLNVLKSTGRIETLNLFFSNISNDRRIQVLIIGFMFGAFIEGAAGFGTPAALAAPLLVSLGFPAIAAAMVALICNSTPVCFGAVGVPAMTAVSVVRENITAAGFDVEETAESIYRQCAMIMGVAGSIVPLLAVTMMIVFFEGNAHKKIRAIVEIIPLALLSGAAFAVPYILIASFLGPELPSIIGAITGLAVIFAAVRRGILVPKTVWEFKANCGHYERAGGDCTERIAEVEKQQVFKAAAPYLLIALFLLVTRLPHLGIKEWIAAKMFVIPGIGGYEGITFTWKWLNNPGIFPFLIVALIVLAISRKNILAELTKKTIRQTKNAALALFAGVAMVKVLQLSYINNSGLDGMLTETAKIIAGIFGQSFPLASPVIGVIGAFVSGSCTVSNTLFASLQFDTAYILGLPVVTMVAMQSAGGAIGNMICVNNVVAVCATTGAGGAEGKIIVRNLIPLTIIYIAVVFVAYLIYI